MCLLYIYYTTTILYIISLSLCMYIYIYISGSPSHICMKRGYLKNLWQGPKSSNNNFLEHLTIIWEYLRILDTTWGFQTQFENVGRNLSHARFPDHQHRVLFFSYVFLLRSTFLFLFVSSSEYQHRPIYFFFGKGPWKVSRPPAPSTFLIYFFSVRASLTTSSGMGSPSSVGQ